MTYRVQGGESSSSPDQTLRDHFQRLQSASGGFVLSVFQASESQERLVTTTGIPTEFLGDQLEGLISGLRSHVMQARLGSVSSSNVITLPTGFTNLSLQSFQHDNVPCLNSDGDTSDSISYCLQTARASFNRQQITQTTFAATRSAGGYGECTIRDLNGPLVVAHSFDATTPPSKCIDGLHVLSTPDVRRFQSPTMKTLADMKDLLGMMSDIIAFRANGGQFEELPSA